MNNIHLVLQQVHQSVNQSTKLGGSNVRVKLRRIDIINAQFTQKEQILNHCFLARPDHIVLDRIDVLFLV
eukprot:m.112839 g.112839  ORF g.112839 m.112839 type:complete len:70 (-) comp12790_c2_seq4:1707-1916(-)